MDAFLDVKYKQVSAENLEELMELMNVGVVMRKLSKTASPAASLSRAGDVYTFTLHTPLKSIKTVFTPGQDFIETRSNGVTMRSRGTVEGGTLTLVQTEPSGRRVVSVQEYSPDTLTIITTIDGWDKKCIRVYERVK